MGLPAARAMVRWKRTSWMRYSVRVVEGGVHLGDFFGEFGEVLLVARSAARAARSALEDEAGLEHLPGEEAVESAEDAEGAGVEGGGAGGDEGAGAVTALMTPMAAR